jgi:membrane-associated phospholipid phosphatase
VAPAVSPKTPIGLPPRTFWCLWGGTALLFAVGLGLLGPQDLPLSQAIADPAAPFAQAVSRYGELPAWLVVTIALGLWLRAQIRPGRAHPLDVPARAIVAQALLHPLLITQLVKFFWGRLRFVELQGDFSRYTPFYEPAGFGVGQSFPSGHVAMAGVAFPLVFFFARRRQWLAASLSGAIALAYVGGTAYGRILAGAHYLTDCWFSAGLALLIAAWLVRVLDHTQSQGGGA